ncbi:MAG: hypothetical protein AB8B69_17110 [Chitinophagales bacterium]
MKHFLLFICLYLFVGFHVFAQPKTEQTTNIYDYEKVVVLELKTNGEDWEIEVQKVCQGVPTKSVVADRSIKMDFFNTKRKVVYSVSVGNPKQMHIHTEHNGIPTQREFPASTIVMVPYDHDCAKVVCSQEKEVKSGLEWKKSFAIQEAVAKANQSFVSQ